MHTVPQQEADVDRSLLMAGCADDEEVGVTSEVECQPSEGLLSDARIGLGRRVIGACLIGAATVLALVAIAGPSQGAWGSPASYIRTRAAVSLTGRSDADHYHAEALDIAEPDRTLTAVVLKHGEAPAKGACTRSSKSTADPSLFCWSLLTLGDSEEFLLKGIFEGKAGIFACNDYAVISRKKVRLGKDECGKPFYTWKVRMPKTLPRGHYGVDAETNSFLNVKVFIDCWQSLFNSGKVWENDFTVKVDSDAVVFPDRIRTLVGAHKGEAAYFPNCRYWGGDPVGKLFGALEVFSKQALGVYHNKNGTCMGMPWQRWGEDMFMDKCMTAIGVKPVGTFQLTSDTACPMGGNPDCHQKDIAAFHPHKDGGDWWNCWKASMATA